MAVDQRDAARKLADLREKLSRSLVDHRRDVTETVALGDRDMARQYDEHAWTGLAGFEQHFAAGVVAHFAEPAHARDLRPRESGKGLLEARKRACQQRAAVGLVSSRGSHSHLRLTSQEASKTCRGAEPGYSPGFSSPPSSGAAASPWEGAGAMPPRPRVCDFRRLRFSRNASLSRSRLASFFAKWPLRPSALSPSSVIMDPFRMRLASRRLGPDISCSARRQSPIRDLGRSFADPAPGAVVFRKFLLIADPCRRSP